MSGDERKPIIIKRVRKAAGAGHGGAWKIAYADFVTAMMAFFLLMWLLGSTTQGDLKGIADFFQAPLKVSLSGGAGTGTATSIIQGGGQDLTRSVGDMARGTFNEPRRMSEVKVVPRESMVPAGTAKQQATGAMGQHDQLELERIERSRLQDVKSRLEAVIEANPDLRQFRKQLLLDLTSEGLRIQIVDEQNRPMFDSASADMKPYTRVIVRAIGQVLNKVDNRISISGHTDAAQFAGRELAFSNWELSANRANACRRELLMGGMAEGKILRVVGLASSIPLDKKDPLNPVNRRITLIVTNKRTERAIMQEGQDLAVTGGDSVAQEAILSGARRVSPLPALHASRVRREP